jgi:tripartite-type tricarboxylate transporter receptor subunit TctC
VNKNAGKKKVSLFALVSLLFVFSGFSVFAQEYPSRPIKIIVPYPPGGVMDLISRSMADPMAKVLGQPVVIENKPGGGTSLGYSLVASAKPDGYTIGHCSFVLVNNYLAYDVAYHPIKSFTYLGRVGNYAWSFVVKAGSPWKNWDEFVDYSRRHPNEIRVGFSNPVGGNTIAPKWIEKKLGLKWRHVSFDGDAPCVSALLGGHIEAFPGGGAHNILVKDGRGKMLLALTSDPIPDFPDVPTFKQLFGRDITNGAGYMAPAGVPDPILKKLEKALYEATKAPQFQTVMEKMLMTPQWRTSQEFTQDMKSQFVSWQEMLRDLNLLKKKE